MKPVSSLPGEFHVSKTNGGMGPKSLTVNGRGVGRFHIICKLWSVCSSLSRNCKHLVPGAMAVKPAFFCVDILPRLRLWDWPEKTLWPIDLTVCWTTF